MKKVIVVLGLVWVLGCCRPVEASVVINEILADPPAGTAGDANGDGNTSSTQDEFVEILNLDSHEADISGWSLKDAVTIRHIFSPQSILQAFQYFVVFSGGQPNLPMIAYQAASKGSLGLNNSNEDVFLYDQNGQLIDHVHYGAEGDKNQSLVRFPEGEGSEFVLHSSIPEAQSGLFSPGQSIQGELRYIVETLPQDPPPEIAAEPTEQETAAVPELPVSLYAIMGGLILAWQGRFRKKEVFLKSRS